MSREEVEKRNASLASNSNRRNGCPCAADFPQSEVCQYQHITPKVTLSEQLDNVCIPLVLRR